MLIQDLQKSSTYRNACAGIDNTDTALREIFDVLGVNTDNPSFQESQTISIYGKYYQQCRTFFKELRDWDRYKRIYSIDPDFYKDLSSTESINLDFSIMNRLPYDSFYIDLSQIKIKGTNHYEDVTGLLVHLLEDGRIRVTVIDSENHQYNPYYFKTPVGRIAEKHELYYGPCRFVNVFLDKSQIDTSLEKSARSMLNNFGWQVKAGDVVSNIDTASSVLAELLIFTVQFLYFLHSKTNDIVPVKNGERRNGTESAGEVRQWNVGVRYGEKMRSIDRKQRIYGDIVGGYTKNRPRPYVRCAHWHRYWCGSGENKVLEPRWIEPVFCNGSMDDIVAVINEVTDKNPMGSDGEELIKAYLDKYKVTYQAEYPVVINNHRRRFDFRIEKDGKILFVEFDGEQHFHSVEKFGGMDKFRLRQTADRDKNKYAKKNRIPLLRIRYDQKGKIPELIDAFLEKPGLRQYNPLITNKEYYSIG